MANNGHCTHHWLIETWPVKGYYHGVCLLCDSPGKWPVLCVVDRYDQADYARSYPFNIPSPVLREKAKIGGVVTQAKRRRVL